MTAVNSHLSTGLPGLDRVLKGLIPGDNIVWQVDTVEDYLPFIEPYSRYALGVGQKLVYFRFAKHPPLLPESAGAEIHETPSRGRLRDVHHRDPPRHREDRPGRVSTSSTASRDLAVDWYSDQMLGNFFMLTCPYLFDVETIALLRPAAELPLVPRHRSDLARRRRCCWTSTGTSSRLYIHPLKVQQRYSPTMYMLHAWEGDDFAPVTRQRHDRRDAHLGALAAPGDRPATAWACGTGRSSRPRRSGRRCARGEAEPDRGAASSSTGWSAWPSRATSGCWSCWSGTSDLADLLDIGKRMIGTGLIGGKSVGMLLARAILRQADAALERGAGAARLVLHRLRRVLHLPGPQRHLVDAPEAARRRELPGRRREGPPAHADGQLPGLHPAAVRGHARLLRPVAHHRALLQPAGGQLRQRVRRQVRERLLRQPGPAAQAAGGLHVGRAHHLRQHHEREGPALPRPARHAGPRRADGPAGPARLRRAVRQPVLPADRRRGLLVQPVRLERVHRPGGRGAPPGLRPGHAGRGPQRRRLHARRGPQRPAAPARGQLRRGPPIRPAPRGRAGPGGQPARLGRLRRGGRAGASRCRWRCSPRRDEELAPPSRRAEPERLSLGAHLRQAVWRRPASSQDMREMLATLQDAYDYPVDVEFTANFTGDGDYKINLVQCRPLPGQGRRGHRRSAAGHCAGGRSCWRPTAPSSARAAR